jgi:hypothetical protein
MSRSVRHLRLGFAILLTAGLAACTSLNFGTTISPRALDYLNDDIASLVFALDLPYQLAPVPEDSEVTFDIVTASLGERHVTAILIRADADAVVGTLPPPAEGRGYYVFGFSEDDKTKIREAQEWVRSVRETAADPIDGEFSLGISPRFCATRPVNLLRATFSVFIALPGGEPLQPLIANRGLSDELGAAGAEALPDCAA